MSYKTLMHATHNEDGKQEVEIVYKRTFWRWLFRMPELTEAYVGSGGTAWYRKDTGECPGTFKEIEICEVVERLRKASVYTSK